MKTCDGCGKTKPLDDFHAVNGTIDGHRNECKDCRNEKRRLDRFEPGPRLPPERVQPALYRLLFQPEEWKDSAACAGDSAYESYDPYFPGEHGQTRRVEATRDTKCVTCPVAFECLEYSVRIEAVGGLWGGLYGDEYRRFINGTDFRSPKAKHKHAAKLAEIRDRLEERASA